MRITEYQIRKIIRSSLIKEITASDLHENTTSFLSSNRKKIKSITWKDKEYVALGYLEDGSPVAIIKKTDVSPDDVKTNGPFKIIGSNTVKVENAGKQHNYDIQKYKTNSIVVSVNKTKDVQLNIENVNYSDDSNVKPVNEPQEVEDKSGNLFSISPAGDITFLGKRDQKIAKPITFEGDRKLKVASNLIDDQKSMGKNIPSGLKTIIKDTDYEIVDENDYRFKIFPDGKLFVLSKSGKLLNKEITGQNKIKAAETLQNLVKNNDTYPYLFNITKDKKSKATQKINLENEDMSSVIDDKGTHYRILTSGQIFRFGITDKLGKFVMDDPSIKMNPDAAKKIAADLLAQNSNGKLRQPLTNNDIETLMSIIEGGSSNDSPIDKATNILLRTLRKAAQSLGTKIHLVGFADYLLGRTETFTEDDLNEEYKKDLAKVAKIAVDRYKGEILGTNNFVYKVFWPAAADALDQPKPSPPLGPNPGPKGSGSVEDLMYFIGGMTVKEEGSNYVIEDTYDFDDYYTKSDVFSDLNKFVAGLIQSGTTYQKVRKIAAWRQASGYTGYRIKITLPISLANA